KLHAAEQGIEGPRINFDLVEDVLTAKHRGEEVRDGGQQRICAKLPGIASAFETQGLGQVDPIFIGLSRQDRRAPKSIETVGDASTYVVGVAERFLHIA